MGSKPKIKIVDNMELRCEIERSTELLSHVDLAKWAITVALHVLHYVEKEFPNNAAIENAIKINELWQKREATVHQVRQPAFEVHEIARRCESETAKAAARALGQAVSTGHMKGHAMVSSDYAIKAVGLDSQEDINRITEEREWQLNEAKKFIN